MEPVLDNDSSSTGATFTPLFFSQQDSIEYWPSASALKELEEGKQPLSVDLVSPYRLAATPRVDFLSHPQISQDSEGPLSVEESTRTAGEAAERVASVAGGGGGGPLPRESYTFKPQPAQYNQIRPVPPSTGVTHPRREVQWQHSTVDNPPSSVRSSSHISKSHPVRSPSFISNVGVAAHERSSASSWIARGNSFLSEAEIKKAVYEATDQAKQDGQIALALAIDQLYEESLHTRRLADTLHAVLAKHPSPEQQFEFNAYIEQAQKRHKESIRKIQQVEDRVREEANGEVADQSGSEAAGGAPVTLTSPTQLSHAFLADSPFAVQSSTPSITRIVRLANLPVRRRKPVKMASLLDCSDLSSLSSLSPPPQSDPESTQTPDRFTPELSDSITKHQLATDRKSSSLRTSVLGKRPPSKASKNRGHVKRSAKEAGLTPEPEDPIVEAKRRKYREKMNFDDYRVAPSSLRNSLKIVQPVKTINTKIRLHPGTLRLPPPSINGHLSSEQSTPGWSRSRLPTSGLAVPPNDRGRVSQAGTPTLRNTDSKARPQKKARVKMSPMKKRPITAAGSRGPGDIRESAGPDPPRIDDDEDDSTNDDYCSACSGQGELLCCDGCDRSFHFGCLDPPMDISELEGHWYCCMCTTNRLPLSNQPRGLFSTLLHNVEKKNPCVFSLPQGLREYFTGMKTGEDGSYEDLTVPKRQSRIGYDEEPDLLRLKDSKGQSVLCYRCGCSSLNGQRIIDCDFCSLHWHLDCVDPPMANPPNRGPSGQPRKKWMCPNHVAHDLRVVPPEACKTSYGRATMRAFQIRMPKKPKIVDVQMRRGFRNNGLIEIEMEDSDSDQAFEPEQGEGIVNRLPERGIILDFMDKMKRHQPVRGPASDEFDGRPLSEQQTILNLVKLARREDEVNSGTANLTNLVMTLVAEAAPEVVELANGNLRKSPENASFTPPNSSTVPDLGRGSAVRKPFVGSVQEERALLLRIQEIITERLDVITPPESTVMSS